jgi:hypothetical protein
MLSIAAQAQQRKDSIARPKVQDSFFSMRYSPLPANYYYTQLGFFCKKEMQLQKVTKIPVKIRLGSVDYTDAMEGKKF